jgi:membrane protease YdiL (CAAX protease family)
MSITYIAGFSIPCTLLCYGLITGLPFLLAKTFPKATDFNKQWLPNALSQWAWFIGMVALIFASIYLYYAVSRGFGFKPHLMFHPYFGIITPNKIIFYGFIVVVIAPIAEEIFFRGYLLEQLKKLTPSGIALVIQSSFFAFTHLFYRGIFISILVFLYGLIFGSWRIKFKSLVPIILAHILLNAVFGYHLIKNLYDGAVMMSETNVQIDWEKILSKPNCQQILLLKEEPTEKAVPDIIAYFADPDKDVQMIAEFAIINKYRGNAEPYIKEALASKDKNVVFGALFVIESCHYSNLKLDVRKILWSNEDPHILSVASTTLEEIEDE